MGLAVDEEVPLRRLGTTYSSVLSLRGLLEWKTGEVPNSGDAERGPAGASPRWRMLRVPRVHPCLTEGAISTRDPCGNALYENLYFMESTKQPPRDNQEISKRQVG